MAAATAWFVISLLPLKPPIESTSDRGTWPLVLNLAFSRNLAFGTEVLFTSGPWGFVGTQYFTPSTYPLLLVIWLGLLSLMAWGLWAWSGTVCSSPLRRVATYSTLLLIVTITGSATTDVFCFLLSFVLLLLLQKREPAILPNVAIALALSLLSLAKFSCLMATLPVVAVALFEDLRQHKLPASALSFISGLLLFWVGAHQRLGGLWTYLRRSFEIASGYSEAMALAQPSVEPSEKALFFFASAILITLFALSCLRKEFKVTAFVALSAILFVAYKAGFVRQDAHMLIPAATIFGLTSLSAPLFWRGARIHRLLTAAMCLAGTACFSFALLHYTDGGLLLNVAEIVRRTPDSAGSLLHPDQASRRLAARYIAGMAAIRTSKPLPDIRGTVDVYPWHQSVPIAYGFNYTPRPVFESYSAYSPLLARLNADHLVGSAAPQTILFDVGTIDDRYPSLDDGPSWPLLLSRYDVAQAGPAFLRLTRRAVPKPVERAPIATREARLGEELSIPPGAGAIWCEIDVRTSFAGKLITILLRQPPLVLRATTAGAAAHDYRLVPSMGRAGFLLSPLVEDRSSFAELARGLPSPQSMVTAIKVLPAVAGDSPWFRSTYQIRLTTLRVEQGDGPAQAGAEASRISRDRRP